MDASTIQELLMPITYGRHLARRFPIEPLLAGTGLTAADLQDRDRRITVAQALQYIRNTLDLAAEPDWYLEWASSLSDHFHGPISLALISAPTLGEGLDAFVRFFPGRVPYLDIQGRRDGDVYHVEINPLLDLGRCTPVLIETPLIILLQYLDMAFAVDLAAARVDLGYPTPAHADRYDRYFRCPVRFDATHHALVIPAAWLTRRNFDYQESSWAHAVGQCEATLSSSVERTTLAGVLHYLGKAYATPKRSRSLPTADEVARQLHVAPRTLLRHLQRMGTSYQAVVDDFLKSRAAELLENDRVMIKEVAAALGFTNPANFGKAFKRWYGISPGGFRAGRVPSTRE